MFPEINHFLCTNMYGLLRKLWIDLLIDLFEKNECYGSVLIYSTNDLLTYQNMMESCGFICF